MLLLPAGALRGDEPEAALAQIRQLAADYQLAEAGACARALLTGLEARGLSGTSTYGEALNALASVEVREGKPLATVLARTDAARKLVSDPIPQSEIWVTTGAAHYGAGDYQSAIASYERALALDKDSVDARDGMAQSLSNLQRIAPAIALHEEAIRRAEQRFGPEDRHTARSIYLLGVTLRLAGKPREAEQALQRAIAVYRAQPGGTQLYLAETQQALGAVYRELGEPARALPLILSALTVYENVLGPGHKRLVILLNNAGLAANTMGDYALALRCFHRAIEIGTAQGMMKNSSGATLRGNFGIVLRASGRLAEAREQYEAALALQEHLLGAGHPLVASILYSLAVVLGDLGDLTEQRARFERACAISSKTLGPAHLKTLECNAAYAINLSLTGKPEDARTLAQSTLAISRRDFADNLMTETAAEAMAAVEKNTGHFREAAALYREVIALREKTVTQGGFLTAGSYLDLAQVEQRMGHSAESLRLLEQAEARERDIFGSEYGRKAELLEAKALALRSLARRKEAFEAALESAKTQTGQALALYSGLAEREALALSSFLLANGASGGWETAFALASERGDAAQITAVWDLLVHSRAAVLDAMSERSRLVNTAGDPELKQKALQVAQARENLARETLSSTLPATRQLGEERRERLRSLRANLEEAEHTLARASASFARNARERDAGFNEVKAALPPLSALVAYAQAEGQVSAFFLAAGQLAPKLISLGSAANLERKVKAWRASIEQEEDSFGRSSAGADTAYRAAGAALRRAALDPVAPLLTGIRYVYLVPAGPLQLVNFDTLPAGHSSFLVETGPEIRVLAAERDLTRKAEPLYRGGLLGIGAPAHSGAQATNRVCGLGGFAPLPGAAAEVRGIAELWRNRLGSAQELYGLAATKAAVRQAAPGKRAIHFATHGFYLPETCQEQPYLRESPLLRSGLVLAGKQDDEILTAAEAASLNLEGTELVVLSGCETGTGVLQLGEGALGLARAFRIAGAGASVSSLWPVRDLDARAWMREFYRSFAAGRGAQEAAHLASLTQLHRRRAARESTNPFYWGAFTALGKN